MLTTSRAFLLSIDGSSRYCMIPYADMLNHQAPSQCKWYYDDKKKCYSLEALEDIAFGHPITASYADKDNWTVLMNYGFVMDNNVKDFRKLTLAYLSEDEDVHH